MLPDHSAQPVGDEDCGERSGRAADSEVTHGLEVNKLTGRWSVTQGFPWF